MKTLQAITVLGLFTNNVENGVDQLSSLSVMTFGPVVSGAGLSENEVIGAEDLSKRAGSDAVHGSGFEIHENRPGHVATAGGLVVVHIDSLQLKIRRPVSLVPTRGIDAVLVADNLPELGADLVAALASLNVKDLSHCWEKEENLGFGS